MESLTDCMVRYTVSFDISSTTRYVASTMNDVVRYMESLTDCTVRCTWHKHSDYYVQILEIIRNLTSLICLNFCI